MKALLKKTQNKIELIFLAACESEMIGRMFQECGVPHVICVLKGRQVLDEAAIKFTMRLYEAIFDGKKICVAFDEAKSSVQF